MRIKTFFCLFLISACTVYGQSDTSSYLSDTNKYKFCGIEIIPKLNYYKIDKNITKCAGYSYDYYSVFQKDTLLNENLDLWIKLDSISPLDSNVTFRTDQVLTNYWDSIYYFYYSDSTVKQILTLHNKGVRNRLPVKFNEYPYYTGIIPIPQDIAPWVESLIYDSTGTLIQKLELRHFKESPYKLENEYFYYSENGEINKYIHLASNEYPVFWWDTVAVGTLLWDTIEVDTIIITKPSKNTKTSTTLTWEPANPGWVYKKKNVSHTNSAGQQISSIDSVWDITTNTWQVYMKSETEYGSQNEILTTTLYSYNPIRNSWIGQNRQEYEYNDSGYINNINYYLFDDFYETWYLDNFCVYKYKYKPELPLNTKVSSVKSSDILVYPNPSSDYVTIENRSVVKQLNYRIFNMNGELIDSGIMINGTNRIDLSLYPSDIYCLQLYNKTGLIHTIKFIRL